jgi:hypothetical protein
VVRLGADAADAGGDARQLLDRAAFAELLEPAEFGHLKITLGDIALRVQEDIDLAVTLQSGHRVDADSPVSFCRLGVRTGHAHFPLARHLPSFMKLDDKLKR